jgi:hypothetical protein
MIIRRATVMAKIIVSGRNENLADKHGNKNLSYAETNLANDLRPESLL